LSIIFIVLFVKSNFLMI